MMHRVTRAGTREVVAAFTDYNVAILSLPAIATAAGCAVHMQVSSKPRTVPMPHQVTAEHDGHFDVLIARPQVAPIRPHARL